MDRTDVKKMSKAEDAKNIDKKSMAGSDRDSMDSDSPFSKPSMLPPPYCSTKFIEISSSEAIIDDRPSKLLISPFRLTVRLLQLAFALASGVSYAIELDHRYSASTSNFIYAEVVFGLTLLALIFDNVTIRYSHFMWAIEWLLAFMWIACFGIFYNLYLDGEVPADYAVVDFGRMEAAGWCNLVNTVLWLGNALLSSVTRYSGVQAAIKRRQEKARMGKDIKNRGDTTDNTKTTAVAADSV